MEPSLYKASPWGAKFHSLPHMEALGAGSAGPGKSMVLLMDPLIQVAVEHRRCADPAHPYHQKWGDSQGWALHLRRTSPMLDETIARSLRIFPQVDPNATWMKSDLEWIFSSGYRYKFGHCKDPDDWIQYQSKQYCVAEGTRVVMGDDSLKRIEDIRIGDEVMTLEGPRAVTHTWRMGEQPCVEAVVRVQDAIVGTQVHPSTHPVLLSANVRLSSAPSPDTPQTDGRAHPNGWTWQDYESLLCGRPASPVKRASLIDGRSGTEVCCGLRLGEQPLPELFVPVVLHARTAQSARNHWLQARGYVGLEELHEQSVPRCEAGELPRAASPSDPPPRGEGAHREPSRTEERDVCGGACEPPDSETTIGSPGDYPVSVRSRDEHARLASSDGLEAPPRPVDAEAHSPTDSRADVQDSIPGDIPRSAPFYPHFYTGEARPRTEAVRMGSMSLRFVGWRQTRDLTVEGANHYITESGLVQAQTHIGYDELVQFTEEQYDQINSRLRSSDTVLGGMLRIRAMSNPVMQSEHMEGVSAHDRLWVRRRFVDKWPQGEKTFYRLVDVLGKEERWDWIYLPAKLTDNPDPNFVRIYMKNLASAKPHIRAALLDGNWYVTAHSYFGDVWDEKRHVVKPFKVPGHWPVFRSMDWGFKSHGCVHWWALDDDENLFCIRELTFKGQYPRDVARSIMQIEKTLGFWDLKGKRSGIPGVADTQLWEQRGDSGVSKVEEMLHEGVGWYQADKVGKGFGRAHNAERIHSRLGDKPEGETPGLVIFSSCADLIRTLPALQTAKDKPELPADGGEDHWVDSMFYAGAYASRGIAGITKRRLGDDYEDEPEIQRVRRGKWGYGSRLA